MNKMKRCGWVVVSFGAILLWTMKRTKSEAIEEYNGSHDSANYQADRDRGTSKLIPVYYNPEHVKS